MTKRIEFGLILTWQHNARHARLGKRIVDRLRRELDNRRNSCNRIIKQRVGRKRHTKTNNEPFSRQSSSTETKRTAVPIDRRLFVCFVRIVRFSFQRQVAHELFVRHFKFITILAPRFDNVRCTRHVVADDVAKREAGKQMRLKVAGAKVAR